MTENRSKESLLKILEKIKEETGLDLTGHADNVVVVNTDKVDFNDLDLEANKGVASEEDLKELQEALENGSIKEVSQECKAIFRRKESIDEWDFTIVNSSIDGISVFAEKLEDGSTAKLFFSADEDVVGYTYSGDKIKGFDLTFSLNELKSREGILSLVSVLAKHIELVSQVYGYMIPSPDVCVEFADEIVRIVDIEDKIKASYSEE